MLNGKIVPGQNGIASNLGHVAIKGVGTKCLCGNTDCLFTYAGGDTFSYHYFKILEKQKPKDYESPFKGMAQSDVSLKMILDASAKGDPIARQIVETACIAMAKALAMVINLINPEMIIIGGQIGTYSSDLVGKIAELTKTQLMYEDTKRTAIVQSKFNKAAVIGAYYYVLASVRSLKGKKAGQVLKNLKSRKSDS